MTEPTYDSAVLAPALAGKRRLTLDDGTSISLSSAIILDLDGKGIDTLGRAEGGVRHDLDGDGLADRTSWAGAGEAFLFFDRDGNGTVSDQSEIDLTAERAGATTALQGLRGLDSNNDGVLSALDARFGDFRIWQDRNANGVADAGEIQTLTTANIRSIGLTASAYVGRQNGDAVGIVAIGSYTRASGVTATLADAALTYLSVPRDGLPTIDFAQATFDRKSSKYRITARDGRMTVSARKGAATVDARAGGTIGALTMAFKNGSIGMLSAIVLDLDGDGVTTTGLRKSRGWFDMNGDGATDRQGWIGRRDGFLVIDRNGDGVINNGSELGFMAEDGTAAGSLAALAKLDSDGNRKLDASDARFGELRVWIDANGNGGTDQGELRTLADLKIQSISLDQKAVASRGKPGENLTLATTIFTYENGMSRTAGDVALAFRPSQPVEAAAAPVVTPSPPEIPESDPAEAWPRGAATLPNAPDPAPPGRTSWTDTGSWHGANMVMPAAEAGDAGAGGAVGERDRSLWAQASTLIGVSQPGTLIHALNPADGPAAIVFASPLLDR